MTKNTELQLKLWAAIDRPISEQSKYQDTVVRLAAIIFRARLHWLGNYETYTLEDCFSKVSTEKFDIHSRQIEQYFQTEIRDKFDKRTESKLQDRYANGLWSELDGILLTTFHYIEADLITLHNIGINVIPSIPDSEEHIRQSKNLIFLSEVHHILYGWCMVVINSLKTFAPELYLAHRAGIAKYINLQDDEDSLNTSPQPEPTVKLKLNCSPAIAGYIMAELYRAGYIDVPTKNTEVNYAEWGRLCSQLFQLPDKYKTNAEGWRNVLNIDAGSKNQLPDYKRAKIRLPDLKDLE